MVTIKDGCGCDPCDCDWKQKLKEAYSRAIQSVNKIGDNDGSVYFPDGTGFVKLPLPRQSDVSQIRTNTEDIVNLKVRDTQLQADINAETTAREEAISAEVSAREAKDTALDADIARIDNTDAGQDQRIQDNTDKITSTYNDLVSTESTVATHNTQIINLQSQTEALSKSLVSDVMMSDGTTAGSVQVSIEKVDGTVVTSANYKWGRDIGVRLEAGTQAGYIKTVISLSDGTVLESNEYKIVEVLESDVYVTAITLVPDMAAGTIGGNISYSNGTTQSINTINVPTAPGVTSAIEALQSRMTAVEQKNTTQDSQISALDARIQAIEDTPGISQFASGKLGTIAGSTADGRVKAEDDGTGSVNGWSALKQRVTTAEGQIVTAQNDIGDIKTKNTQQDSAISGLESSKVNVSQGAANAGKALVVGADGNVAPGEISSGKKLTSKTLQQLINFNTSTGVVTVPQDIEVEYIAGTWNRNNNKISRMYFSTGIIHKGTYNFEKSYTASEDETNHSLFALAPSLQLSSTYTFPCYIKINWLRNDSFDVKVYANTSTSESVANQIFDSFTTAGRWYRLYV